MLLHLEFVSNTGYILSQMTSLGNTSLATNSQVNLKSKLYLLSITVP